MVEWSITAVLKTAALRGAGGSNPSLSAHKGNLRVTFFRYVGRHPTPRPGESCPVPLRKRPFGPGANPFFLSKGLISKPLVRLFYWQTISGNLHKIKQNKNKEAGETKKMTSNTVGSHPLYALRGSNPGPID